MKNYFIQSFGCNIAGFSLHRGTARTPLPRRMTTLAEVFPCFFLSCKANARVKPAKTGHGPHSTPQAYDYPD